MSVPISNNNEFYIRDKVFVQYSAGQLVSESERCTESKKKKKRSCCSRILNVLQVFKQHIKRKCFLVKFASNFWFGYPPYDLKRYRNGSVRWKELCRIHTKFCHPDETTYLMCSLSIFMVANYKSLQTLKLKILISDRFNSKVEKYLTQKFRKCEGFVRFLINPEICRQSICYILEVFCAKSIGCVLLLANLNRTKFSQASKSILHPGAATWPTT